MAEAFGRAIADWYHEAMDAPLVYRDGADTSEHPIERYYFDEFQDGRGGDWLSSWLEGPLVDLGAGAGRDTLHFQERFETVALEVSASLVALMEERGVEDARRGDMFALRELFGPDRFRSGLIVGTQACLAGSMQGLRTLLDDLAHVTTPDATVVLDSYDPTAEGVESLLGYREDPAPGLAHRVAWFYDPTAEGVESLLGYREDPAPGLAHRVAWFEYGDLVDPALYFRLFGPDRLRAAAEATGWTVAEVVRPHEPHSYKAALEKR